MPRYETGFQPPAPVLRGAIVGPAGVTSDVALLIDTGADVSVVPRAAATSVGAHITRATAAVRFLAGPEVTLEQVDVALELERYRFRGTFLVVDADHGIVGRNILNALALLLDGPRLEWSIART
jgi:predicted aspartyl protease